MNLEHLEALTPEIPLVPQPVSSVHSVQFRPQGQVGSDESSREVRRREFPTRGLLANGLELWSTISGKTPARNLMKMKDSASGVSEEVDPLRGQSVRPHESFAVIEGYAETHSA
jgi:hypothetical protein